MKVKELIEVLEKFDPNETIGFLSFGEDGTAQINYGGRYTAEKSNKYGAVLIRKEFEMVGD